MSSITIKEIISIHSRIAKEYGISTAILNRGSLESIASKPDLHIRDKAVYDDIFKKAACLIEGILRLHPFVDGNKRTGFASAYYFLEEHGYLLTLTPDTTPYAVDIARNLDTEPSATETLISDIATWLEARSKKMEEFLNS